MLALEKRSSLKRSFDGVGFFGLAPADGGGCGPSKWSSSVLDAGFLAGGGAGAAAAEAEAPWSGSSLAKFWVNVRKPSSGCLESSPQRAGLEADAAAACRLLLEGGLRLADTLALVCKESITYVISSDGSKSLFYPSRTNGIRIDYLNTCISN